MRLRRNPINTPQPIAPVSALRGETIDKPLPRNVVPCGTCHLCCRMMTPVRPEMGDDPASYQTATCITLGKVPYMILDRHPNGDCIYLGEHGCTIWERAPYECRQFDCRVIFKNSDRVGRKLAVKRGDMSKEIFDRGRELLK